MTFLLIFAWTLTLAAALATLIAFFYIALDLVTMGWDGWRSAASVGGFVGLAALTAFLAAITEALT
ncbi:hypothetical protein [uncultured Microbacterium sp.]|uniref:hypothetical protein n=1 Tax=uncultured Microbacterium sp. TaxID=191216 RepID=UPI0028E1AD1F|nr:hypothetical protein [uncultured Microbacterium sp.]